jgi:Flp pilus assembly protein TadG
MMLRFLRDQSGAAMVEAAIVTPLFLLLTIGTMDFTLYIWNWNLATKAAHLGARLAIVSNPVATGLNEIDWTLARYTDKLGLPCTKDGVVTGNCPSAAEVNTTCKGGTCTRGAYDAAAFQAIYDKMERIYPYLEPADVQISYEWTGLGFVGRPGGLPMTVTVSLPCKRHQFVILHVLADLIAPTVCGQAGWPIRASATLITEDLTTVVPSPGS